MITFVEFACRHYVYAINRNPRADYSYADWLLARIDNNQIDRLIPDDRVTRSDGCPECVIEGESLDSTRQRAFNQDALLNDFLIDTKEKYLRAGIVYHLLDFSQKVDRADDPRCATAHEQFWISKTPITQDPFFAAFEECARLLQQAMTLVHEDDTFEGLEQALSFQNTVRFLVNRVFVPINEIDAAVKILARTANRHHESRSDEDHLANRQTISSKNALRRWRGRLEGWSDDLSDLYQDALMQLNEDSA